MSDCHQGGFGCELFDVEFTSVSFIVYKEHSMFTFNYLVATFWTTKSYTLRAVTSNMGLKAE